MMPHGRANYRVPSSLVLVLFLFASPTRWHAVLPPGAPSSPSEGVLGMCIELAQIPPHGRAQALERLLARAWVHGVVGKVVEEHAVDGDEGDETPREDLDLVVPLRADGLVADAPLELALEAEFLLLRHVAEGGRPLLAHGEAVAREVEGREGAALAAEEAAEEAQHGGGGAWRECGGSWEECM
jgi:hypothetical protein